jgi:hypothetical protein
MSIASSSNYHSNAIVGVPQVGSDINVCERHTSPRYSIGFGFTRADGNKFRYVHFGAAVAAGTLVGCSNTNNNIYSVNAIVVAPATAQAVADEVIKPGSAGSRYVEVVLATVANNQYAGGYFVTTKDSGSGYTYRIRGNTATGTPTSGNIRFELYEPLKVALDNTTDIAVAISPYVDLDEAAAIQTTTTLAGVSACAMSADNWGWVCTSGVVGCLFSDTGLMSQLVRPTLGTAAGAVAIGSTISNLLGLPIGYVIVPAGAANQQGVIRLFLE